MSILEAFIDFHRVNRSLENLISIQADIIRKLAVEIDDLKKHSCLPRTERDREILDLLKKAAIGGLDHMFWSRGYTAYKDPFTGEVDQHWKPSNESTIDKAEVKKQNPKIIDLILYKTRQRGEDDRKD
jgi:hypothetical protein